MAKLTPKLPLRMDDNDGAYKMITDYKELARQNLKNLVLTNPGEKTMDSNFGVGVKRYLFDNYNNIDKIQSEIFARLSEQVSTYLSYIDLYNVRVTEDSTKGKINIAIYYNITPLGLSDSLDLAYETNNIWR